MSLKIILYSAKHLKSQCDWNSILNKQTSILLLYNDYFRLGEEFKNRNGSSNNGYYGSCAVILMNIN